MLRPYLQKFTQAAKILKHRAKLTSKQGALRAPESPCAQAHATSLRGFAETLFRLILDPRRRAVIM